MNRFEQPSHAHGPRRPSLAEYEVQRAKVQSDAPADPKYPFCPTYEEMALRHQAKADFLELTGDEIKAKKHRRVAEHLSAEAQRALRLKGGFGL